MNTLADKLTAALAGAAPHSAAVGGDVCAGVGETRGRVTGLKAQLDRVDQTGAELATAVAAHEQERRQRAVAQLLEGTEGVADDRRQQAALLEAQERNERTRADLLVALGVARTDLEAAR